jgi:hypothetical protein
MQKDPGDHQNYYNIFLKSAATANLNIRARIRDVCAKCLELLENK